MTTIWCWKVKRLTFRLPFCLQVIDNIFTVLSLHFGVQCSLTMMRIKSNLETWIGRRMTDGRARLRAWWPSITERFPSVDQIRTQTRVWSFSNPKTRVWKRRPGLQTLLLMCGFEHCTVFHFWVNSGHRTDRWTDRWTGCNTLWPPTA